MDIAFFTTPTTSSIIIISRCCSRQRSRARTTVTTAAIVLVPLSYQAISIALKTIVLLAHSIMMTFPTVLITNCCPDLARRHTEKEMRTPDDTYLQFYKSLTLHSIEQTICNYFKLNDRTPRSI